MNGYQPSKFARQSKQPSFAVSLAPSTRSSASTAFLRQNNSSSRSGAASRSSSRFNENSNDLRQRRLNRVQPGERGQHSRASTVAGIAGLAKKNAAASRAHDQDQGPIIQVQRNEPNEMSQLTECSSQSASSVPSKHSSGTHQREGRAGGGGVSGWQSRTTKEPGTFLKTNMTGIPNNGRLQLRSATSRSIPQVFTKMVETPDGVRSYQNRRNPATTGGQNEAEELMDSKTPRHRNGGRESIHRSSQQSFATASQQGDDYDRFGETGSAAYYNLGQGSLTWNHSNHSHQDNASVANTTVLLPAPADFAKTMKSDMDSFVLWLAREQKKLQSQQESLGARIREGEAAIDAQLSKSVREAEAAVDAHLSKSIHEGKAAIDSHVSTSIEEVTKHGSSVVASFEKDCESAKTDYESAKKSAKQVIVELKQRSDDAEKSSQQSYAKVKKLAKETKALVQEVKGEGLAAQTLFTKASDALKTVQAIAGSVHALLKIPLKAFTFDEAMIGPEPGHTKSMTPVRITSHEPANKSKASRVDTVFVIEDSYELENISPLTVKSRRRRPTNVTKEPVLRQPVLNELPNRAKRPAPITEPIKKSLVAPSTPTTAAPVSVAAPPKRRRIASTSGSSKAISGRPTKKQAMTSTSGPPAAKLAATSVKQSTTPSKPTQLSMKPVRKSGRKKRGRALIRDIDFSCA